jgi:hypothetical protein
MVTTKPTGSLNIAQTKIEMQPEADLWKLGKYHKGFFVDTKYDGEFNELVIVHDEGIGTPTLINKNGKRRTDCSITEAFDIPYIQTIRVLGELYWYPGKNGALYDFLSNKSSDDLSYAVFDILELNGFDLTKEPLTHRREQLIRVLGMIQYPPTGKLSGVHLGYSEWADDIQDVKDYLAVNKDAGYEGVVVKPAYSAFTNGCNWYKIKHQSTWDLEVHIIDPALERIEVWVRFVQPGLITTVSCGVKCLNRDKAKLKVGDIVEIKHYGQLSGGGLRHPSFVRARPDKTKASQV